MHILYSESTADVSVCKAVDFFFFISTFFCKKTCIYKKIGVVYCFGKK